VTSTQRSLLNPIQDMNWNHHGNPNGHKSCQRKCKLCNCFNSHSNKDQKTHI